MQQISRLTWQRITPSLIEVTEGGYSEAMTHPE
jgi:hypothetical protein